MVLAEKPTIRDRSRNLEPALRDALLRQLSTLAAVYHKLPHEFVKRQRVAVQSLSELEAQRRAAGGEAGAPEAGGAESASVAAASGGAGSPGAPRESEPTAMDLLGGLDDGDVRSATHACAVVRHQTRPPDPAQLHAHACRRR